MAQQVMELAAKPDKPRSIPRTLVMESTDKLSSDVHCGTSIFHTGTNQCFQKSVNSGETCDLACPL